LQTHWFAAKLRSGDVEASWHAAHADAPLSAEYFPAAQFWQTSLPMAALYVPLRHRVQSLNAPV
jgi:hypothetical protein